MNRHFLYLTNSRLVSMVTSGRRIVMRREFAVTGTGAAEFERHLRTLATTPVHLFTDLAEEDFRLDSVPHLGGKDRDAVLARKLAQMFRNTPLRHAVVQGREPEGRRDDRVLYTAITNPEVLRPWLDAIERLHVPLAGVHSAAVFSSVMLEELDLIFSHTLLVTFTPGGAMRQTYFRNREIRFSRLTPIEPEEGQSLGTMVSEETTRTWQYLDSMRNFAEGDRLEVCILLHPSDRGVVQPALRDFAQIQYRILDMEAVSTKLGLRPAPLGSSAEEVFVHLYLMRGGANHFASPEMRRFDTLRRMRVGLARASVVVVVASAAWGAWSASRAMETGEQDQRVTQQTASYIREAEAITRTLPSYGVGGSTMRDSVAFYNFAIRGFPTMTEFAVSLSHALERHPEVRLSQISWIATDDPKAVPHLVRTALREAPPVTTVEKSQQAVGSQQRSDAVSAPFAGGRYEVALVEGTLSVANNDYRTALQEIESLAGDLRALPGTQANVVESPLDVSSSVEIQGRHGEHEGSIMTPRFVLRVVRDHGAAR